MHRRVAGQRKSMATWRNGSAFGFDRRRHQKVAGSSPAVVIFLSFLSQHLRGTAMMLLECDDNAIGLLYSGYASANRLTKVTMPAALHTSACETHKAASQYIYPPPTLAFSPSPLRSSQIRSHMVRPSFHRKNGTPHISLP